MATADTSVRLADPLVPIAPSWSPSDVLRCDATRLKRRILYGEHHDDVVALLKKVIGNVKQEAWKAIDLSSNVAVDAYTTRAVLFAEHPTLEADEAFAALVKNTGLWELMRRVQRDSLGLRVVFVRPNIVNGRLAFRVVWPDMVVVRTDGDDTSRPVELWEARRFRDRDAGGYRWLWEHFDISDPDYPRWRIIDRDSVEEVDVSSAFMDGSREGDAYPWRYPSGEAYIPHTALRAERSPDFWDANGSATVFEGTLWVTVGYSFYNHILRAASWPQRYGVNVEPVGAGQKDENGDGKGRDVILGDPALIQRFRAVDSDLQPMLGQFQAGADPQAVLAAVQQYERAVLGRAGLNPADIHRVSGDPRSGYALALTRDGQRDAQRRETPMNEAFVLELLAKAAAMHNAELRTTFAAPAGVRFTGVRLSADERRAEAELMNGEVEAGHMSVIDAHMQRTGLSRDAAILDLRRIRRDNAMFGHGQGMGPRELAETLQKIYLSVGNTITADEARDILNRGGAGLTGSPDLEP